MKAAGLSIHEAEGVSTKARGVMSGSTGIESSGNKQLCPETIAWRDQVITPPTTSFLHRLDTMIRGMKIDGDWSYLDRMWVFSTDHQDNARVSIVNPSGLNASWVSNLTEVNNPTWTRLKGYQSNGTSSYLNLQFAYANGINFTAGTEYFGFYQVDQNNNTIGDMGWHPSPSTCIILHVSSFSEVQIRSNSAIAPANPSAAQAQGLWSASAVGGATTLYRNTSVWGSGTNTIVSTPTGVAYLCALQSGTNNPINFCTRTYSCAFFGSSSINQARFYNRIQAFMTSIGNNV